MKITLKLVSGFLVISFLIGGLSIFGIQIINRNITEIVERETPKVQAVLEMEVNIKEAAHSILDYTRCREEEDIIRFNNSEKDFEKFVDIYKKKIRTEKERGLITELDRRQSKFYILGEEIIDLEKIINSSLKTIQADIEEIDLFLDEKIQLDIKKNDPDAVAKMEASLEIEIIIEKTFAAIELYLFSPTKEGRAKIKDLEKIFEIFKAQYNSLSLTRQEKNEADIISKNYLKVKSLAEKLIKLDDEQRAKINEFEQRFNEIDNLLDEQIQPIAMVKIKEDERKALTSTNLVTSAIFAVILLSVIGGVFVSLSISRPIIKLRDAADMIGSGILTTRIDIKSRDEIGELASAFNQMGEDLQKAKGGLEKEVEERTEELHTKIDELEKFNRLSIGRELKMIELKEEIKELEEKLKNS